MENGQFLKQGALLLGGIYRIESVLGQGGFGITYLAYDTNLDKKVAVKEFFLGHISSRDGDSGSVITTGANSEEFIEKYRSKFLKEAKSLAKLDHRNLVRVQTAFEENGTAYYVMDYIDGGNLQSLVRTKGPVPFQQAVGYIQQVSDALDYLHGKRLNHLDVKPANIMLRQDGSIALIDFGLAKQYDSQGNQTSTTPVGISHGFAPLEQYNESGVKDFSPATDIYALGATFYYLLSGQVPPSATDLVDRDLEFPPTIPYEMQGVLRKAMAVSRRERFQSASDFMRAVKSPSQSADDRATQIVSPGFTPPNNPVNNNQAVSNVGSETPGQNLGPAIFEQSRLEKPKSGGNQKILIIGMVALAVVILGIGAWFLLGNGGSGSKKPAYAMYNDEEASEEEVAQEEQVSKLRVTNVDAHGNVLPKMGSNTYYGENMFDGNISTCWSVNLSDASYASHGLYGPSMSVDAKKLDHVRIFNGYGKSRDMFNKNTRASSIMIYRIDDGRYDEYPDESDIIYSGPLSDIMDYQELPVSRNYDNSRPTRRVAISFSHYFPAAVDVDGGYYMGSKYDDLAISELEFYGIPI